MACETAPNKLNARALRSVPSFSPLYYLAWSFARAATFGLWRCEVKGLENLPMRGGFIIACNHASYIDPPAIGGCLPRPLHYFARKTLFKPGLFGWLIRSLGSIPIDRDGASDLGAFKAVFKALKAGGGIIVFPEGTRTFNGRFQTAKQGVGLMAVKAGVPVIPCYIEGSFDAYGRGMKLPCFNSPVNVSFGPALMPADIDPGKADSARFQTAADKILDNIKALAT